MSKGAATRHAILDRAVELAAADGLEGLSIGGLAATLRLSKSGLFAHFGSKEALQIAVLEHATDRFVAEVIRPALGAPRGAPRLRALFERWLAWGTGNGLAGGCLFVAASIELDDRPGPARDRLQAQQRDWMDFIANAVRAAVREGHLRADVDAEQFAQELQGVLLGCHHARRLLQDPEAERRARVAFAALLARAAPPAA